MTSNPWTKWFWSDWESDPGLRLCSLAAQGLWMRMLCLAAKADPVGYVKVGDTPCTASNLSKLAGESEETVGALLDELERFRVFSRTRAGTIYNRRMIDDAKRSKTNRENGSKGGKVSVGKQRGIFQSPKPHHERRLERTPEPHKPEAISQKEKEPSGSKKKPAEVPIPNDWEPDEHLLDYAAKHGLDRSRTAREAELFRNRALAKGERYVDWNRAFMNWIQRAVEYRPPEKRVEPKAPVGLISDDEWKLRIRGWTKGIWKPDYGPEPGKPGCRVPSQLLDEMAA